MNRHTTDAVSLSFGVVFLALVAWWLVLRLVEASVPAFGWLLGGVLVLIGGLGVYLSLRRQRPGAIETTRPASLGPADQPRP
jgi:thiol:disulfide interchange protein